MPESQQLKEIMGSAPPRGILDTVLSQPAHTTPAELMQKAYNDSTSLTGCSVDSTTPHLEVQLKAKMSPFQLKSILMEHCYARPHNWRPETQFLRPSVGLLLPEDSEKENVKVKYSDEIDVCEIDIKKPRYDVDAAKKLMTECEKYVEGIRESEEYEDWEQRVPKINWSKIQHNLFNSTVDILNADRMSRLAYANHVTEPALRRSVIEKSVKRFRRLIAQYMWDVTLIQWLHSLLMEYLNSWLLSGYLDILQTMSHKLPTFVEKLMGDTNNCSVSSLNTEHVQKLTKQVWDPSVCLPKSDRLKHIPGDPVLVVIPSATTLASNIQSKRLLSWINLLSKIGKVVTVTNTNHISKKMTMGFCTEQALFVTRSKMKEISAEYPESPIIVVGLHSGSAIALQVAHVENVVGVVCIGFSVFTSTGKRGEPDDNILELISPVLFIVGQSANTTLYEYLEDIRERMNVETGLLMVGGADDYLRVNKRVKRNEGVTQSMVDMFIVEHIYDFVRGLILSPFPPQVRQNPEVSQNELDVGVKRPKIERKRNNSNGSSLDSEPPSPTPRATRPAPVGRPPPSKVVRKHDGKFYSKLENSHISSSPSSNSITPPNPPSTPESFGDPSDFHHIKSLIADNSLSAKIQGMYSGMLPHVKNPGGLKIIPSNPNKQIKVLDSVSLGGTSNKIPPKLPNRPDMIKSSYGTNMVLMPDGRYRAAPPPPVIRGSATSQITKMLTSPITPNPKIPPHAAKSTPSSTRTNLTKFITSKKQLANRPRPMKKQPPSYAQTMQNLPPPANLTSQDILNLPIIFADDNQLIGTTIQSSQVQSTTPTVIPGQIRMSGGLGALGAQNTHSVSNAPKLVFVNKNQGSIIRQPQVQKRAAVRKPAGAASALKYSIPVRMDIDIEGELDVNKIPKKMPQFSSTITGSALVGMQGYKTEAMSKEMVTNKIKQVIQEKEQVIDDDVDSDMGDFNLRLSPD